MIWWGLEILFREATDDYQYSLPHRVNINTWYMYICTYKVSSAVYRITLFLRTISRNVYRGALQARCLLGPYTERIYLWFEKFLVEEIRRVCHSWNFPLLELCSICSREGLGRSKPATNPWNKHNNNDCRDFYYIQALLFYKIKWALQVWVS